MPLNPVERQTNENALFSALLYTIRYQEIEKKI